MSRGTHILLSTLLITTAVDAQEPVAAAAMRGDLESVRALLKSGADVNAAQGDGMTALHWAARQGDVRIARMLLFGGASVRATTRLGGYTPLMLASAGGHAPVLEALLESGADANAVTSSGATPLHLAAASGDRKTITALLERGAQVNARESAHEQTPLMFAAHRGNADAIRLLTKHGADVALATKVVVPPSRSRSRTGSASGSRASRPRTEQRSTPSTAEDDPTAELQAREAKRELARGSGETKVREPKQPSPKARAQSAGKQAAKTIAQRVVAERPGSEEKPAEEPAKAEAEPDGEPPAKKSAPRAPSPRRQGGLTALLHACRQGHIDTAGALLAAGADIDQVSGCDQTSPLLIATINGHFDLAIFLLERGADPNQSNAAGAAPLYAAINVHWAPHAFYPQPSTKQQRTSHLVMIERLLEAGADVNARLKTSLWYTGYNFDQSRETRVGATPFWRAAQSSDVDAMRLLVAYGGDPDIWSKAPESRRRSRTSSSGLTSGTDEGKKKEGDEMYPPRPPVPPGGPACSALHLATGAGYKGNFHRNAAYGWLPAVRYLVEELGFDVNEPDHKGYTPMHHAAFRGDNELIRYLVSKGGDVMAVARSGQTTVDMANGPVQRLQPFPKTIALLESMGAQNNNRAVSR